MRDRLGANPLPIQLPIGAEDGFIGVVDLIENKALVWKDELGTEFEYEEIPAELADAAHEARTHLIEACADYDDELMEAYLDEEEIPHERIAKSLHRATLDLKVTPVLCGSAFKNKGVQPLLDAIVELLPSPLEVPADDRHRDLNKGERRAGRRGRARQPDDTEPFAALAFKVMADPYVGKLTYFRVYSGKLSAGSRVLNATNGKTERIGRLLMMHANHREEIEECYAGDIVAGVGLKQTSTGDTLSAPDAPVLLETIEFPEPVIAVAIEPKTKADQEKLGGAPRAARRGGPDLPDRVRRGDRPDADLRDGRAAPRGDRRPPAARVQRRRQRRPPAGRLPRDDPRAGREDRRPLRPPDRRPGPVRPRGDQRSSPLPRRASTSSTRSRAARSRPSTSPRSSRGSRRRSAPGVKAGYPMVDVRVELVDGKYHDVDSSEMAFKIAGSMAIQEATRRAKPVLLEPVMSVEVVTPEEFLGDVIGDLSRRRGKVQGQEPRGNALAVHAFVPLGEMFGYATDVRSSTQGRATYTMQFERYEEVPQNIAEQIVESHARRSRSGRGARAEFCKSSRGCPETDQTRLRREERRS